MSKKNNKPQPLPAQEIPAEHLPHPDILFTMSLEILKPKKLPEGKKELPKGDSST